MYFFDSDVCIEIMRGHLPRAQEIMRKSSPDLFGVPVRGVVSPKGLKNGTIEVSARDKSMQEKIPVAEAADFVEKYVKDQLAALGCPMK